MRFKLIIIFLMVIHIATSAQSVLSDSLHKKNSIKIFYEFGKFDVRKVKKLKFLLSLTNVSNQSIKIPTEYYALPKRNYLNNLVYELNYCSKSDTIDLTKDVWINAQIPYEHKSFNLSPLDKFYIYSEISVSDHLFKKRGKYRIRFILPKNAVKENFSDDYTEWIHFRIK